MVLPTPPELTPEKEPVLRVHPPHNFPRILPRGLVPLVEFTVVNGVTHGLFIALLALIGIIAWIYYHGFWYVNAAIVVAYMPTYFNGASDKVLPSQGSLNWDAIRTHRFWHIVQRHFRLECVRVNRLNRTNRYFFGLHSNTSTSRSGSLSRCGGMWAALFPDHPTRTLVSTPYFYIPFLRDLLLWLGCVEATEGVAHEALHNGVSLLQCLYDVRIDQREAMDRTNDAFLVVDPQSQLSLTFVRIAMMHGVSLVPVLALDTSHRDNSTPTSHWSALLPRCLVQLIEVYSSVDRVRTRPKANVVVVFGSPIPVERNAHPSQDEVQEVHAVYVEHLRDLFVACQRLHQES
ncbi:hypothetical protein, variant [Aphanomyces invadans]|uniref:Acyltransferase n=1 Tax=Aphanomyces invadans TaxID=157072 RepID=A0A024U4U3_9STRA|nr:hypothetical protein, variant [Aphanomyces invadans]ETW00653.1 hypothetical protein, variant [Aphanomyces invadans]|eukprot:XP_008870788.1 hypothetical protein, variant [Aphanomyces invadans]